MNEQIFSFGEILTITGAGVAVLVSSLLAPPQFKRAYESDLKREAEAGQKLARQLREYPGYSSDLLDKLGKYLIAKLLLEGFYLWKGIGKRIRLFIGLEIITILIVSLSAMTCTLYWALV